MDGGYTHASNIDLPAGYTYFAQFALHDLTHRYPHRLDLTSLYGEGPLQTPEFYNPERPWLLAEGPRVPDGEVVDIPRHADGSAHIPDFRNDRNVIVGQVHASFIRHHNQIANRLALATPAARYAIARRETTLQYRALIAEDLLPRLTSTSRTQAVDYDANPVKAVEYDRAFRLAVGQFGHAMVNPRYRLNDTTKAVLFGATEPVEPYDDLRGQPLHEIGVIDWAQFFPIGDLNKLQRANRIDTSICAPLFMAPTPQGTCSIPYHTLLSGQRAGLLTGRCMAARVGITPIALEHLWADTPISATEDAPLWFYILREAQLHEHGRRLGPLGTHILSNVIQRALNASTPWSGHHRPGTAPTTTVGDFLTRGPRSFSPRDKI
jgi:hypothetical protein